MRGDPGISSPTAGRRPPCTSEASQQREEAGQARRSPGQAPPLAGLPAWSHPLCPAACSQAITCPTLSRRRTHLHLTLALAEVLSSELPSHPRLGVTLGHTPQGDRLQFPHFEHLGRRLQELRGRCEERGIRGCQRGHQPKELHPWAREADQGCSPRLISLTTFRGIPSPGPRHPGPSEDAPAHPSTSLQSGKGAACRMGVQSWETARCPPESRGLGSRLCHSSVAHPVSSSTKWE